jgi:broad specificity phosphatase PhoE
VELKLIRHGESVANREGRIQGQTDYPLSAQGIEQAERLAKWLARERIDMLYSSDLSRAYQTAVAIARYHPLSVITRADVREVKLGRFETLTFDEIREKFPAYAGADFLRSGLSDVEQADQVYARALAVVDDLLKHHKEERVVLVSHGLFISCMLQALLNVKWQGKRVFAVGNTGITTLKFDSLTRFVILGVNEQPHLYGK